LRERQGAQQVAGADRNVALGKALQKDLRARGILIEERCRGSEQQEVAIAWLRAHRLLGLRQKPGMAMRISEGSPEDLVPSGGHILLIAAQHFFRLIAERENRLRRGMTRHAKPCRFACKRTNESTLRQIELTGARGAFKHAMAAQRRVTVESLPRISEKPRIRHGRTGRYQRVAGPPRSIGKTAAHVA
jgi:hypothetical protein